MSPFKDWTAADVALHQERVSKGRALPYERDNQVGAEVSDAKPKCDEAPTLGAAIQGETKSVRRTHVRFIGYRVKPLDPDNFAGSVKDCLDGLKHARLLQDDSPEHITLETSQVKVNHYKDECTVIEIL